VKNYDITGLQEMSDDYKWGLDIRSLAIKKVDRFLCQNTELKSDVILDACRKLPDAALCSMLREMDRGNIAFVLDVINIPAPKAAPEKPKPKKEEKPVEPQHVMVSMREEEAKSLQKLKANVSEMKKAMKKIAAQVDDPSLASNLKGIVEPLSLIGGTFGKDVTDLLDGAADRKEAKKRAKAELDEVLKTPIDFEGGQSNMIGDYEMTLGRVVAILDKFPDLSLSVEGHAGCSCEATCENLELSKSRAEAVCEYLIAMQMERNGVANVLEPKGCGCTQKAGKVVRIVPL